MDVIENKNFVDEQSVKINPVYKRNCIIGLISVIFLLIVLVVIIVIFVIKHEKKVAIGQIHCIYNINKPSQKVQILGNEFEDNSNIDIHI